MMGQILEFGVNMSMLFSGNYQPQFTKAAQLANDLQKKIASLQNAAGKSAKFDALQKRITQNQAAMLAMRKAALQSTNETERARLTRKADSLQKTLDKDRESLARLRKELQDSGVDTGKLTSEQSRPQSQLERSQSAQQRLTDAQSRYQKLMGRLSWGNMKDTVMGAMMTAKMFQAPVKLSMDFEAAMARVKAVGFTDGENLEGFERIKEQALELGAATKFTAVEAARAQENLIRAGMSAEQTMSAMTGTLNMAAAEGMSIDEASAIIAKGLGGMGLESKLAPRYADVLSYTSSKSNTDIRTIAEAMRISAPTAAGQNIQLEQLASYIGALANKGYEGSDVGTAIASSISRLARRPKQADEALRELGVSVMTKSGGLVELPHIMKQLDAKMKGMGKIQKQSYLSRIFGGNFDKVMLAFMSSVSSGEQERLQAGEYIESFGWSKKQADINLETLAGQMDILVIMGRTADNNR